ncbi:hypothetical protein ACTVZO_21190 [Streptomyces sp. IBSNAI002]|uniref:hypothetical protein n=1 Tax=Streptomyces sp. IBSNAI002 TaxID=3457500 RepID=UPI003FD2A045
MIQGFRPRRWPACAVLAAAALASLAPAHALALAPAHALALAPAPHAAAPAAAPAAATPARGPHPEGPDAAPERPRDGLAGSAAGAGRPRPGRPVTESADPEMLVASRPLPARPLPERPERPERPEPPRIAPTPPAVIGALGTETNGRAADLAAHILPLGTGFALMGVGLGYLGMRLRKGL